MAGTITVSGMAQGLGEGGLTIGPVTITGSANIGEKVTVNLATGDNTVAVPTGAVALVFTPPGTNTATLKFRTNLNSGDSGLSLSPSDPFEYAFRGLAVTSVIINAQSAVAGCVISVI